jgi:NAD(P)-dependent dehydrogenase (short-subunit alcohol dehydrogenase family)
MKQCLITGGGSKFGQKITEQLVQAGYHVHLVTSNPQSWQNYKEVTPIMVNWSTVGISDLKNLIPRTSHLDLVFFNHNSSALDVTKFQPGTLQNYKNWQQNYFVACQFPFYVIHAMTNKISPDTKIAWMLSQLIFNPTDSQVGYADYIGNKFTNACIMKSFSLNYPACFFGIHPDGIVSAGDQSTDIDKANNLVKFIESSQVDDLNGKIFSTQGKLYKFQSAG